jgi:putative membrane protein
MKFVSTILGCILFVLFFSFALKNTHQVDLHFFLNYEVRGPLVLMLLAFFVAGAFLGILAVTPTVFRHRRESSQHKNTIQALQSAAGTAVGGPQPDGVTARN